MHQLQLKHASWRACRKPYADPYWLCRMESQSGDQAEFLLIMCYGMSATTGHVENVGVRLTGQVFLCLQMTSESGAKFQYPRSPLEFGC